VSRPPFFRINGVTHVPVTTDNYPNWDRTSCGTHFFLSKEDKETGIAQQRRGPRSISSSDIAKWPVLDDNQQAGQINCLLCLYRQNHPDE
jgi:hypothetical protein